MIRNLLIIFVKNPVLGKVKTRLAKTLGDVNALEIYRQLLLHTLKITSSLPDCDKAVYYADFIEDDDIWPGEHYQKYQQKGTSLGDRMLYAFDQGFNSGYSNIILIGSDCVELSSEIILTAFNSFTDNETVIGPARDGGYYLIGMKRLIKDVFLQKSWSTNSVLKDTLYDLQKAGAKHYLLPELSDIDDEEDFKKSVLFKHYQKQS